ncbi:chorismate synthase [Listeria costaricensis]|uniref:chorismate synthase n=1 Tax=Listeria costaricensis TaxID=2026604 RepID=UPI000C07A026|nr:chorismate synthase [Listeria costaricensis]
MFGFGKTETEKKRDKYHDLYDDIKDAVKDHKEHMSEIDDILSTYNKSVPDLPNNCTPSDPFIEKNTAVVDRLKKYINKEKDKLSELTKARDKAYEKYQEYKAKAIKEEAERERKEKEKKEKEKKEREAKNKK